jgi:hypothetical protein
LVRKTNLLTSLWYIWMSTLRLWIYYYSLSPTSNGVGKGQICQQCSMYMQFGVGKGLVEFDQIAIPSTSCKVQG